MRWHIDPLSVAMILLAAGSLALAQTIGPVAPQAVNVSCGQLPAFTGDVTTSAGACATTAGNAPAAASWTPSDNSGASLSITVNAATFVKIGKLCVASFIITYPSTANGSNASIGGLPCTSANLVGNIANPMFCSVAGVGEANIAQNTATFNINSSTVTAVTNATLSTAVCRGTLIYPTT